MDEKAVRLPMSERDMISGVGFLHQTSVGETFPLHNHEFYELFYVLSGKAVHRINQSDEILAAGTLEFIRPDDTHKYSFLNQYDMELVSVGIEKILAEEILNYINIPAEKISEGNMPKKVIFTGTRGIEIKNLILAIGEKRLGGERRQYAKSIFPLLFYELFSAYNESDRFIPDWLNNIFIRMSEKDNFLAGLPYMLEIANVSQEHLNREFKRFLGLTPTEFINMKRIEYSSELLSSGKYTIAAVSEMCGFGSLSHFYANFEKFNKCSPKKIIGR